MTKFAKVEKAFSKSIRFLSSNKELIGYLMSLIVVWTFLFCFVKLPPNQPDINGKPIKITCNEYDKIKYPRMKDDETKALTVIGICACCFSLFMSLFPLAKKRFNLIESVSSSNRSGILQVMFQLLLWVLSLITGGVFVWLWVNNGPTETLAPNFLAACKPNGLDVLCNTDSHLDGNPVVWVTCSTPPSMWIPALSNALPTLAAIQAYLMFATLLQIIYYCEWEEDLKVFIKPQLESGLLAGPVFTFLIGYFDVISDNLANFDQELVSGYLKCCAVACVWLAVDRFWTKTKKEPKLPLYWNDVPVNNEIAAQTGQSTTNLTPPPTPTLHEPPATTESGTTTGETTENVYQTIYPDLSPEYENPPSYRDSVIRY
jgi:hypothetical protein